MKKIIIALALLLICAAAALAHEHRHVGPYELAFGWRVEPALAGQINGPEVFIAVAKEEGEHGHDEEEEHEDEGEHEEGEAHTDELALTADLQIEVTFGGASMTMPMRQVFNEPGHYVADLIPTLPGDYTFRIFGTIGDVEVDETFSSSDGEFSSVEPVTDVMFPTALPDLFDLLSRIEALEAEIQALKGE